MTRMYMSSKSSSESQAGTAYPWIIVILSVVLLLITNANNSVFGIFFKPMANEFAWSRGAVSVAAAIRWATMASLAMSMGHLSDRIGTRANAANCCSLIIAAPVFMVLKTEPLMWIQLSCSERDRVELRP